MIKKNFGQISIPNLLHILFLNLVDGSHFIFTRFAYIGMFMFVYAFSAQISFPNQSQ